MGYLWRKHVFTCFLALAIAPNASAADNKKDVDVANCVNARDNDECVERFHKEIEDFVFKKPSYVGRHLAAATKLRIFYEATNNSSGLDRVRGLVDIWNKTQQLEREAIIADCGCSPIYLGGATRFQFATGWIQIPREGATLRDIVESAGEDTLRVCVGPEQVSMFTAASQFLHEQSKKAQNKEDAKLLQGDAKFYKEVANILNGTPTNIDMITTLVNNFSAGVAAGARTQAVSANLPHSESAAAPPTGPGPEAAQAQRQAASAPRTSTSGSPTSTYLRQPAAYPTPSPVGSNAIGSPTASPAASPSDLGITQNWVDPTCDGGQTTAHYEFSNSSAQPASITAQFSYQTGGVKSSFQATQSVGARSTADFTQLIQC